MKLKQITIKEPLNQHLYKACLKHFEDLGYEVSVSTQNGHGWFGVLIRKRGQVFRTVEASKQNPTHTWEEFFALTPEDVIEKPKELNLTADQIRKAFGVEDGTEVTIGNVKI